MIHRLKDIKLSIKFATAFLLVGIIPFAAVGLISSTKTAVAMKSMAFNQLKSVRDLKKNQVKRYLGTIRNQSLTFTENRMVIDAMKEFQSAFNAVLTDNALSEGDIDAMREKLGAYYENDFRQEYKKRNDGRDVDSAQMTRRLDDESVALQYYYIGANPNPLGNKELLDRADDRSRYSRLHREYHPVIRSYLKKFGYYDIFLVDHKTGEIVYSVFKELDYTTSLLDGPHADTNFAEAFRKANAAGNKDAVVITDLAQYLPSYEAPAGFIASPIFDGDTKIGIGIFQFPIDQLDAIMSERSGMGETGETYLVGSDFLMRSDSHLDPEHHSLIASFNNPEKGMVKTDASSEALRGKSGEKILIDYNGNPVLSAYTPLQVGDTQWALIAEIDKTEAFAVFRSISLIMSILAAGVFAAIVVVAILMTRSITRPIKSGVDFALAMSKGDLQQTLSIDQKDEIGMLAAALNDMGRSLSAMFREIAEGVETLSASASQLSTISSQMVSGTGQTREKADLVASAAEEMSQNMNSVAASSEQTATSVMTVAAAAEKMSAALHETGGNTEKGRSIATEAVNMANSASAMIVELGEAATEVGKVTESISEISEQTNLLALNATIEAARAGEAGKGFAVVAGEIKALASSTAEATRDISQKIQGMQTTTDKTIGEINRIEKIILDINDIVTAIAAGTREQTDSTEEIAGNMNQAATGIAEVNENVAQSSEMAGNVAKDMVEVNQAARQMSSGSLQISQSAEALNALALQLNEMIQRFRI